MTSPQPSVASTPVRVLAVDDDPVMVTLIRRIAEKAGHVCDTALSAADAIEQLSRQGYDLLITDITMPGLSGLDLVAASGAIHPDLAMIVVTGVDDPSTAETALASGAFGYVVKPFELPELTIAMSTALRRRELEITQRRHLHDLESEVARRTEELRSATGELLVRERRFRSLAQASPLGILYADQTGDYDYSNGNAAGLLGRAVADLTGRRWIDELDSPQRSELEESIRLAASGVPDLTCEYQVQRPDGSRIWLCSRIAPVLDDNGHSTGVVVLFEDIGDRKRLEEQLRRQANLDPLTGLSNRRDFRDRLGSRLLERETDQQVGVLLVDLDQFKLVNDTYGHEAGDTLIVSVARALSGCVPDAALLGRLGGDEFVVAVVADEREEIIRLGETVRLRLRQPVRVIGVELSLSASVGVAMTADAHTTVESLLRSADMAMHRAKDRRDTVTVFDASMARDVARRLAITSGLRRAIDEELLTVDYQPVVDTMTQRLLGLEALARWSHHEWGPVSPTEFIPIAESTGLVHHIDRQVLTAAIKQLAAWRAADRIHPEVFVSVNLSASQLANSDLPDTVAGILGRFGVAGSSLVLEITESTLVADPGRAIPILTKLRELGVRIAVDDFGIGHSALSYLGELPLDSVKIDKSFIARLGSGAPDLVETIVALARRFNLTVVAEGVEEPHQLDELKAIRCDMVQGFLTGRPTSALSSGQRQLSTLPRPQSEVPA